MRPPLVYQKKTPKPIGKIDIISGEICYKKIHNLKRPPFLKPVKKRANANYIINYIDRTNIVDPLQSLLMLVCPTAFIGL